jgi:hypothetical protein
MCVVGILTPTKDQAFPVVAEEQETRVGDKCDVAIVGIMILCNMKAKL